MKMPMASDFMTLVEDILYNSGPTLNNLAVDKKERFNAKFFKGFKDDWDTFVKPNNALCATAPVRLNIYRPSKFLIQALIPLVRSATPTQMM